MLLITLKGALSWPMRNEIESWLPADMGWTEDAIRIGPSVVRKVGPRSSEPLR